MLFDYFLMTQPLLIYIYIYYSKRLFFLKMLYNSKVLCCDREKNGKERKKKKQMLSPRSEGKGSKLFYRNVCVLPSIYLSVTNISGAFFVATTLQVLEIKHSLFSHAIWWDSFLYQSDVNYLLNGDCIFLNSKLHTF